jgi:hypothetical protein
MGFLIWHETCLEKQEVNADFDQLAIKGPWQRCRSEDRAKQRA